MSAGISTVYPTIEEQLLAAHEAGKIDRLTITSRTDEKEGR